MKQYVISKGLYYSGSRSSYSAVPLTPNITQLVANNTPTNESRDSISRDKVFNATESPHSVLVYDNERVFQLYREIYVEKSRNPFVTKSRVHREKSSKLG